MTTQDTGLVERALIALYWTGYALRFKEDEIPLTPEVAWAKCGFVQRDFCRAQLSSVIEAILPHLSAESQALLRKELNGE